MQIWLSGNINYAFKMHTSRAILISILDGGNLSQMMDLKKISSKSVISIDNSLFNFQKHSLICQPMEALTVQESCQKFLR